MNSRYNKSQSLRIAYLPAAILVLLLTSLFPGPEAYAGDLGNNWLIGIDGVGSNIGEDEDGDTLVIEEDGGGGALQVGYSFSPSFQLRFYGSGALHETSNPDVDILFSGALFEAVYLFKPGQNFRPYVFGGLGGFVAESQQGNFTYSMEGPGASLGGGLHYFLNNHVSIHSSVRLEAVNWDTVNMTFDTRSGIIELEAPIDESGTATTFTLGMGLWF